MKDREDIPALVHYFVQEFARRMHKQIDRSRRHASGARSLFWPGNVRELANLIERAAILSRGPVLEVPLAELDRRLDAKAVERGARRESNLTTTEYWRLCGNRGGCLASQGAAARLGMKRTTLQSRLRKLGITRPA